MRCMRGFKVVALTGHPLQALSPFKKLLAVYVVLGRSLIRLAVYAEQRLLKLVGWLSGAAVSREGRAGRMTREYLGFVPARWHLGLATVVLGGLLHTAARKIGEQWDERLRKSRLLRRIMGRAPDYAAWRTLAEQLEKLEGEDPTTAARVRAWVRGLGHELLQGSRFETTVVVLGRPGGRPRAYLHAASSNTDGLGHLHTRPGPYLTRRLIPDIGAACHWTPSAALPCPAHTNPAIRPSSRLLIIPLTTCAH